MKLNKILALTAVFATLFANFGMLFAQGGVALLSRYKNMSEEERKVVNANLKENLKKLEESKQSIDETFKYDKSKLPEIYSIEIRNETYEAEPITDYGEKIYSSETMYIAPRIHYKSYANREHRLDVKWIKPDGSIRKGSSSPSRYSYSENYYFKEGEWIKELDSWGSKTKGNWKAGDYAIEIWCEGTLLKRKEFTIYRRSSSRSSDTYVMCSACNGSGQQLIWSIYGSYYNTCYNCGGTGRIKVRTSQFQFNTDPMPVNTYSGGGYVPVNTNSGSYENNNTDTKKTNNYFDSYGEKDCPLCHGTGTCQTCGGKGWYYSSYGTGTVTCPNCCSGHVGKCSKCCGTGKTYGKKY